MIPGKIIFFFGEVAIDEEMGNSLSDGTELAGTPKNNSSHSKAMEIYRSRVSNRRTVVLLFECHWKFLGIILVSAQTTGLLQQPNKMEVEKKI